MNCPNCNTPMSKEPCTYKKTYGSLGDASIHYCEDCGYQVEVRHGKRIEIFDGVLAVDIKFLSS